MAGYPLVALCGYPKTGKSTVQEALFKRFGILPVDDGRALRDACKALYGLTEWHVSSQEGKASYVRVGGEKHRDANGQPVLVQVRQLLGDLGVDVEARHGAEYIPENAIGQARAFYLATGTPMPAFSFGSVRRNQGNVYRRHGGIVIGVRREGYTAQYDFDIYDESLVDLWIDNDAPSAEAFQQKVIAVLDSIFGVPAQAA